jgi:hypothetical protein
VACEFSALAGPAIPVRTSSPSSAPPGTRSGRPTPVVICHRSRVRWGEPGTG